MFSEQSKLIINDLIKEAEHNDDVYLPLLSQSKEIVAILEHLSVSLNMQTTQHSYTHMFTVLLKLIELSDLKGINLPTELNYKLFSSLINFKSTFRVYKHYELLISVFNKIIDNNEEQDCKEEYNKLIMNNKSAFGCLAGCILIQKDQKYVKDYLQWSLTLFKQPLPEARLPFIEIMKSVKFIYASEDILNLLETKNDLKALTVITFNEVKSLLLTDNVLQKEIAYSALSYLFQALPPIYTLDSLISVLDLNLFGKELKDPESYRIVLKAIAKLPVFDDDPQFPTVKQITSLLPDLFVHYNPNDDYIVNNVVGFIEPRKNNTALLIFFENAFLHKETLYNSVHAAIKLKFFNDTTMNETLLNSICNKTVLQNPSLVPIALKAIQLILDNDQISNIHFDQYIIRAIFNVMTYRPPPSKASDIKAECYYNKNPQIYRAAFDALVSMKNFKSYFIPLTLRYLPFITKKEYLVYISDILSGDPAPSSPENNQENMTLFFKCFITLVPTLAIQQYLPKQSLDNVRIKKCLELLSYICPFPNVREKEIPDLPVTIHDLLELFIPENHYDSLLDECKTESDSKSISNYPNTQQDKYAACVAAGLPSCEKLFYQVIVRRNKKEEKLNPFLISLFYKTRVKIDQTEALDQFDLFVKPELEKRIKIFNPAPPLFWESVSLAISLLGTQLSMPTERFSEFEKYMLKNENPKLLPQVVKSFVTSDSYVPSQEFSMLVFKTAACTPYFAQMLKKIQLYSKEISNQAISTLCDYLYNYPLHDNQIDEFCEALITYDPHNTMLEYLLEIALSYLKQEKSDKYQYLDLCASISNKCNEKGFPKLNPKFEILNELIPIMMNSSTIQALVAKLIISLYRINDFPETYNHQLTASQKDQLVFSLLTAIFEKEEKEYAIEFIKFIVPRFSFIHTLYIDVLLHIHKEQVLDALNPLYDIIVGEGLTIISYVKVMSLFFVDHPASYLQSVAKVKFSHIHQLIIQRMIEIMTNQQLISFFESYFDILNNVYPEFKPTSLFDLHVYIYSHVNAQIRQTGQVFIQMLKCSFAWLGYCWSIFDKTMTTQLSKSILSIIEPSFTPGPCLMLNFSTPELADQSINLFTSLFSSMKTQRIHDFLTHINDTIESFVPNTLYFMLALFFRVAQQLNEEFFKDDIEVLFGIIKKIILASPVDNRILDIINTSFTEIKSDLIRKQIISILSSLKESENRILIMIHSFVAFLILNSSAEFLNDNKEILVNLVTTIFPVDEMEESITTFEVIDKLLDAGINIPINEEDSRLNINNLLKCAVGSKPIHVKASQTLLKIYEVTTIEECVKNLKDIDKTGIIQILTDYVEGLEIKSVVLTPIDMKWVECLSLYLKDEDAFPMSKLIILLKKAINSDNKDISDVGSKLFACMV